MKQSHQQAVCRRGGGGSLGLVGCLAGRAELLVREGRDRNEARSDIERSGSSETMRSGAAGERNGTAEVL